MVRAQAAETLQARADLETVAIQADSLTSGAAQKGTSVLDVSRRPWRLIWTVEGGKKNEATAFS